MIATAKLQNYHADYRTPTGKVPHLLLLLPTLIYVYSGHEAHYMQYLFHVNMYYQMPLEFNAGIIDYEQRIKLQLMNASLTCPPVSFSGENLLKRNNTWAIIQKQFSMSVAQ